MASYKEDNKFCSSWDISLHFENQMMKRSSIVLGKQMHYFQDNVVNIA